MIGSATRRIATVVVVAAVGCTIHSWSFAQSKILRVGPERKLTRPSQAAEVAKDGAVIEIDAGLYVGDAAVWRQDNLTIRAVGGYAHLQADGVAAEGKAIWVIKGKNTRVEGIEFSGARVEHKNGAGIRLEGAGLTVIGCYFHDNQNGILTSANPDSDIVIERSEFAQNGHGDGKSHNIYVGKIRSLEIKYCYIHHARIGHNVKSRASTNRILYSRIMDEQTGNSSHAIDLPEGGEAYLIGNLIQQGPLAENWAMVNYASRKAETEARLHIINNTFVNDRGSGIFIKHKHPNPVLVINNIFAGRGELLEGPTDFAGNLVARNSRLKERITNLLNSDNQVFEGLNQTGKNLVTGAALFVDAKSYDYRLLSDSPAIDAGIDPGQGFDLAPVSQYIHPFNGEARASDGKIDVGAYEYVAPSHQ